MPPLRIPVILACTVLATSLIPKGVQGETPEAADAIQVDAGAASLSEMSLEEVDQQLNNPLTTVLGNAEILQRKLKAAEDEDNLRRVDRIIKAVERIQDVIRRLREAKQVIETEYVRSKRMIDLDRI